MSHFTVSPRHLVGLIAGALCISFAPIFAVMARQGDGQVGMWDSAFWRVFLGAIALGILFGVQRKRIAPRRSEFVGNYAWMFLPGLAFACDFWAWHWSFEHTSVANSTLLANTSIIWVTLFAWLVWKERLSKLFLIGASAAFLGMLVLMLSSTTRESPTGGNGLFGDSLAILTAVFYASYQLLIKRFRRDHSAPMLLFWASAVAALILFPLAWFHKDPFLPGSVDVWGALIGLGVLSHACGQGLIAYGLGGVPASLAAVALLVQPVATALLGVAILGQPLVLWQIVGAVFVVAGLVFAVRAKSKSPVPATDSD
jgi:drug/metabolite transporter (DMT)-like permease